MDPRKRHHNLTESLNPKQSMVSLELPSYRQTQELQMQHRSTRSSSLASQEKQGDTSFFGKLKACLGFKTVNGDRTIFVGRDVQAQIYAKNIVKNQKYSVLSLVPIVLYHQFKYFFNLFYLVIAVSQFVPALKVGFLFTYLGPLGLVLGLTMLKEGYDDFKRYQRDKEANSALYNVLKPGGVKVQEQSSKLKVGDIIELTPAQRVPADLILLYSTEENGTNFIKTDQLDGETDWKLRRAVRYTQEFFSNEKFDIAKLDASISCKGPSQNIYHFEGVFEVKTTEVTAEPLFLEHTVWADTKITAGKAYGVLIYSGKETRIVMNSRQARSKSGKLENELNFISKILFIFMLFLSAGIVALNGFYGTWPIQLFRYLLLLSSIIPISLRVNLDFAKVVFSLKINTDKTIPGTIARNSTIPEELGRISYLLTDKTGTLTKNEMYFRKLVMEGIHYEVENLPQIIKAVRTQCEKNAGPLQDIEDRARSQSQHQPDNSDMIGRLSARSSVVRREKDCILRDLATAVSVCHNVTPVIENDEKTFHASSPDEIALVKFAQDIKMKLIQRNNDKILIENAAGIIETYKVIANFPFSSETKRMGILVRHEATNRIIFYLKGADTVISPRVKEVFRALLLDECENLARTGLRTMVFAQRLIKEDEFNRWKAVWDEANLSLNNRDEKMRSAANLLEVNMDFVGITGVEDLLQDDINDTIESLRNAGIKIWMLTGDKVETAKCIAISTGLKHANDEIFEIKDVKDDLDLSNKLNQFSNECNNKVLLIDGAALTKALENNRKLFFESAVRAPAVICSRCLPNQKAVVAEMVKSFSQKRVACIGDGGNDVGMIQAGDIGIGIVGKEGKQASLASDFSIMEFKSLKALILWHGRLYYKNSAKLSQFIIHRGLVISFIQMFFTLFFYYVAIQIYNGYLLLGYTTVYTSFPVFSLVFDEDISREHAYNYPVLYKTLQKSRELNLKTFLIWMWKSLFQAAVIMVMAIYLFPDTFLRITTITFTALILAELLNVYTELNKLHRVMIYSLVGTVIVYFLSIILFKSIIAVDSITWGFMGMICIIVAASWLPLHIAKLVMKHVSPTDHQKIMKKF